MSQRRARATPPPRTERRARLERRLLLGYRSVLTSGLNAGWLCFEADEGKRRLTPIPGDWERCRHEQLEKYCAQATPARPVT